ncbi:MAG: tyrosine protein phosphatase [Actinomycetia bacterium]|nr:tyrosine protein phosphatase [Actinomycetes bacterium]
MIDLHSHVLPGLDDGAVDLDEAVEMCRAAAEDGTRVLAATPHVRDDYPTTPLQMEQALAALRAAVGDSIRLVGGGEIDLAQLERPRDELARFALAGNPKYLLVETPYGGWPLDLPEKLFLLLAQGITPVLAHPERNTEVQERPDLLEPIVAGGTLVQLTAASIDGRMGRRARACAATLLDRNLAHLLASDAHAPTVRAIGMSAAVEALGDEALARWLTVSVPSAIVENEPLPPRPRAPRPRRRFFRR